MKKTTALLMAVLMTVLLFGCGKEEVVPETLETVPASDAQERAEKGLGHYVEYVNKHGKEMALRYHTSAREIKMRVGYVEDILIVTLELGYPKAMPFAELETIRLGKFTVSDSSGEVLITQEQSEAFPIESGTITVTMELTGADRLGTGIYSLHVENLIGEKAEAEPVDLVGPWDFSFALD